ncbi:DNA repair protein [Fistulina hepatica ATCC 64428]|nr:DNA repair protein [Fistulina hepatica ATCC 64428]
MSSALSTDTSELTSGQIKLFELNRLKAKANQRWKEQQASSSTAPNANGKRPLAVISSPTAPGKGKDATGRRERSALGPYFEYDLSKMVNTKGGFLVQDDKEIDEATIRKEKERERQRAIQNVEPSVSLDANKNPKCRECNTMDIDQTFRKVFRCLVCKRCQNEMPEKYSLLTKTECKEDYLLTDPELRDEEAMPHLLKANPHKSTFANMMLFVRYQVEEFAWKKWGSPEALDTEYEKRMAQKKRKKNEKFEKSLRDLRKRTKESVWQQRQDAVHKHVYGPTERRRDGTQFQICHECGFTVDIEEY